MRANRSATIALAGLIAAAAARDVSAHRLDECLQSARIAVEPDHLALDLDVTPGVAIAETIIAEIDRDRDGVLSAAEQQQYAAHVLGSAEVRVDGRPVDVPDGVGRFPDVGALRRGEGTIQLHTRITLSAQTPGTHQVFFRNRYRREVSVYLANALVPESSRVAVTAQQHDPQQRDLTIDYQIHAGQSLPLPWLFGSMALAGAVILARPTMRP